MIKNPFMNSQSQKTFSFSQFAGKLVYHRKKVASNAGSFVLMSSVLGSLTMMHLDTSALLKMIQLLGFFGLGCVQVSAVQGASFLSRNYFLEYLVYTGMIGGMICLVLAGMYYFTSSDPLMAYASTCCFLLPFFLVQSWFFYKHIPREEKLVWNNKETEPDEISRYYQNKTAIRLRVTEKYFDIKEMVFPLTVSSWVKLGILFNQFALEQNRADGPRIELKDEKGSAYGWEFFAESLEGFISKQLDPELDLKKNKINRNAIVVARRVILSDLVEKRKAPMTA
jgi:Type VI secretion system, TssN